MGVGISGEVNLFHEFTSRVVCRVAVVRIASQLPCIMLRSLTDKANMGPVVEADLPLQLLSNYKSATG